MSTFQLVLLVPLVLLTLGVAGAVLRRVRARRRAKRRVVEKPNSHYTSHLVRNVQSRHRWHDMRLDQIHEINREEVVRLLARVEAAGVDVLSEREREFLDYMAELSGTRTPEEPGEVSGKSARDPRRRFA